MFRYLHITYICMYITLCVASGVAQTIQTQSDSQFSQMGALFDLNASSIVTDVNGNVTSWNDALKGTSTYTRSSSATNIQKGTLGSTDFVAVDFGTSANNNKLVGNQSQNIQTVILVNNVSSGVSNMGLFGKNSSDFGLRMDNATEIRHRTTGDNNNWNSACPQWLNGSTTDNVITKPNILAVVGRSNNNTGNITTAVGGYYDNYNRCLMGQIAEVLAFNFKLSDGQIKIVNTLMGAYYGFEMTENSVYVTPDGYNKNMFYVGKSGSETNSFNITENGSGGIGLKSNVSFADSTGIIFGNNDGEYGWSGLSTEDYLPMERQWSLSSIADPLFDEPGNATLTFAFDFAAEDAMEQYNSVLDDSFVLMYRAEGDATFSVLNSTILSNPGNGYLELALTGTDFKTGFYSLGALKEPEPVPEPSTWVLLSFGLLAVCLLRRKRMK